MRPAEWPAPAAPPVDQLKRLIAAGGRRAKDALLFLDSCGVMAEDHGKTVR